MIWFTPLLQNTLFKGNQASVFSDYEQRKVMEKIY